jgi:hypothetical protein
VSEGGAFEIPASCNSVWLLLSASSEGKGYFLDASQASCSVPATAWVAGRCLMTSHGFSPSSLLPSQGP